MSAVRPLAAFTLLVLLVLFVNACASSTGSPSVAGGSEPPTDTPTVQPDTPISTPAVDPSRPGEEPDVMYSETPIVATEGTPRVRPFESAMAGEGNELIVRWWSGVEPCTALAGVDVVETDSSVSVTISEASIHPDDADVACIEIAQAKQHTIELDAPLGDREVIDGAA